MATDDDDFDPFVPDMQGDCPACDGTGEVCCNCDGRGCSLCMDGMRTCERCDGSGYLAVPSEDDCDA